MTSNPLPEEPPELFVPNERPVRSEFTRIGGPSYTLRRIVTIGLLLAIAGGVGYLLFAPSASHKDAGSVPVVKGEGAYKERPEQPGGMDIPHQDMQVYQELDSSGAAKPEAEHLLPPPETPQIPAAPPPSSGGEAAAAAPPAASAKVETLLTPSGPDNVAAAVAPVVPPSAPAVAAKPPAEPEKPEPSPPPAATAPVTVAAKPVVAAKAPVAPSVVAQAAPQPAHDKAASATEAKPKPAARIKEAGRASAAVQLAAVQDEAAARAMAEKLQARYASYLGDARLKVVRADLGAKGIYYRIQSGAVTDGEASGICAALKKLKAGCIVVHP